MYQDFEILRAKFTKAAYDLMQAFRPLVQALTDIARELGYLDDEQTIARRENAQVIRAKRREVFQMRQRRPAVRRMDTRPPIRRKLP